MDPNDQEEKEDTNTLEEFEDLVDDQVGGDEESDTDDNDDNNDESE